MEADGGCTPAVTLSWRHIRVAVRQHRQRPESRWADAARAAWARLLACGRPGAGDKIIVDDVSGSVDGGSFLAVVGASGTGKTTLLAAVTKRLRGSAVLGDVLLNGRTASAKLLSRVSGFVPQKDLAVETLSASEHLNFIAVMRLDARTSAAARSRRVRVLLGDLGLSACADTRLAKLSGGERRRVAIAEQLMVSPLVLALDEPCSGLDSEGSRVVLEALRREAGRGRAVLCTVHQAAPDLLRLFSHILVLSSGRVVFHGPLLDAQPFLVEAAARADWGPTTPLNGMLQQLCDPAARLDTARACAAFAVSAHAARLNLRPTSEEVLARDVIKPPDIKHVSWLTEVRWLLWREALDGRRKSGASVGELLLFLLTAAIIAFSFVNVAPSSLAGVQSLRGLLYLVVSEVVFTHSYAVFHTFPAELAVFLREAGLYSPSAYYASKALGTVPRALVEPALFVAVIQTQVDLTAGAGVVAFLGLLAILFVTALTASAYGCMLSAQFRSPEMVMAATLPVDFIAVLVAGIFSTTRSLPSYIRWARFVSVFYYGHELLAVWYWSSVPRIDCPQTPGGGQCPRSGTEVLDDMGFDADRLVGDLLGLGALCVGLHAVGFLGILRRSRQTSAY